MLGAAFDLLSAFSHLAYLAAGATLAAIGLVLLGYSAYVRLCERRYSAQVVATRKDGKKLYWPTIAYTDAAGVSHEATADTGSSALFGRAPGTPVRILAGATGKPTLLRDWWFQIGTGLFIAGCGVPFLAFGLHGLRFDRITAVVALGLAIYAATKAVHFIRRHKAVTPHTAAPDSGALVTAAEIAGLQAAHANTTRAMRPWLIGIGAVLCIGGGLWLSSVLAARAAAISVPGVVIDNEASETGDSPSYYAVFRYADAKAGVHIVRDSFGSSPAWYAAREPVAVLYAPADPAHGWIDRGIWSWLPLLAASLLGAVLLLTGLVRRT